MVPRTYMYTTSNNGRGTDKLHNPYAPPPGYKLTTMAIAFPSNGGAGTLAKLGNFVAPTVRSDQSPAGSSAASSSSAASTQQSSMDTGVRISPPPIMGLIPSPLPQARPSKSKSPSPPAPTTAVVAKPSADFEIDEEIGISAKAASTAVALDETLTEHTGDSTMLTPTEIAGDLKKMKAKKPKTSAAASSSSSAEYYSPEEISQLMASTFNNVHSKQQFKARLGIVYNKPWFDINFKDPMRDGRTLLMEAVLHNNPCEENIDLLVNQVITSENHRESEEKQRKNLIPILQKLEAEGMVLTDKGRIKTALHHAVEVACTSKNAKRVVRINILNKMLPKIDRFIPEKEQQKELLVLAENDAEVLAIVKKVISEANVKSDKDSASSAASASSNSNAASEAPRAIEPPKKRGRKKAVKKADDLPSVEPSQQTPVATTVVTASAASSSSSSANADTSSAAASSTAAVISPIKTEPATPTAKTPGPLTFSLQSMAHLGGKSKEAAERFVKAPLKDRKAILIELDTEDEEETARKEAINKLKRKRQELKEKADAEAAALEKEFLDKLAKREAKKAALTKEEEELQREIAAMEGGEYQPPSTLLDASASLTMKSESAATAASTSAAANSGASSSSISSKAAILPLYQNAAQKAASGSSSATSPALEAPTSDSVSASVSPSATGEDDERGAKRQKTAR